MTGHQGGASPDPRPVDVTVSRTSGARTSRLVAGLAIVGIAVLLLQAWGYGAWLLTAQLEPIRSSEPVPEDIVRQVRVAELSSVVGATIWLGYVTWDWWRRRTLTWPLLWTIAWACVFWQEPLVNARNHTFSFNREFHNVGDWTTYLPLVPHSYTPLPEALILEGLVFLYLLPLLASVVAALMRVTRRRLKVTHPVALAVVGYLFVVAFDTAFELQGIQQGLLRYVEIGGPAVRAGEPGQWPLYEGLAISAAWAFPGILTYFLRDHGSAARRVRHPRWSPGRRPAAVTILAAVGATNLVFGLYNAGFVAVMDGTVAPDQPGWFAMHPDG